MSSPRDGGPARARSRPLRVRTRLVPPRPPRITERERPLPQDEPPLPQRLVHQLLAAAGREREAAREQARARSGAERERYARLAADVAAALHELRGCLAADGTPEAGSVPLRAVTRRFAAALAQAGVQVDDPRGSPYADVARRVDVGYAPPASDTTDLIVSRTVRPGVLLHDGTRVHRAQVLLEARPHDPAPEPPHASPDLPHSPPDVPRASPEPPHPPAEPPRSEVEARPDPKARPAIEDT
ncbi:hypothetical protein DSC45_16985 [Streptomyces sp. YIM 130001]|uniref:hypothetical protein n=1 Tax=Streptomyces sp. YIM 130001 TaxID=2259644 RepID=UPI000E652061|nr:hypothetical protein [Streptomyces sp. YIM 130001]RII15938.1 hypothetical protein DSC45_16985 [Streptomyces sp. YIM 130001]